MAATTVARRSGWATARWLVLAFPMTIATLVGCAPTRVAVIDYPRAVRFAATADSLGLEAFAALPVAEQAARRQAALGQFAVARQTDRLDVRLRSLHTAVGLAPDLAEAWLALVRQSRRFGDYQMALAQYAQLRRTAAMLPSDQRRSLSIAGADAMAWLGYDRGEWFKGLAWVDSMEALGGVADETVRGLLLAGSGQFLYAEDVARLVAGRNKFSSDVLWITGMAQWYRGNPGLARSIVLGASESGLRVHAQRGPDAFIPGELRPEPVHAAECWRDLGSLEETLGNHAEARKRYERSWAAVPGGDAHVLRRDHTPMGSSSSRARQPVWLAFDRYFVTGSISAFTALAYERFERATEAQEREFWAGAAIDGAGICLRRQLDEPWALRVRGLLQVAAGRDREGRDDLRRAWTRLEARNRPDYATAATLGHLELEDRKADSARRYLAVAVRLRPDIAASWSDYGLALILTGDLAAARGALDTALSLDPGRAVAWYNRGLMHFHAREWEAAVADLRHAAELAPDDQAVVGMLQRAQQQASRVEPRP